MGLAPTAPCLLQRGGGSLTGPQRARPGRRSGVLLLLRPVCYCLWRWRLCPPTRLPVVPSPVSVLSSGSCRPCILLS